MIDLRKLPEDRFDRLSTLILEGTDERLRWSTTFLKDTYSQREMLDKCLDFLNDGFRDAPSGDIRALKKNWLFPWAEAERALCDALHFGMLGYYRSAYEPLRRALELVVCGCYFTLEHISEEVAERWMRSEERTPNFERALIQLEKRDSFRSLKSSRWPNQVSDIHQDLSRVIHTRGTSCGYDKIQPTNFHMDSFFGLLVGEKQFSSLLDRYIIVVRTIATVLASSNPILLVGLPIVEKFGLNPPISGFFDESQSESLKSLLLDETRDQLIQFANTDQGVSSMVEGISQMPDLTQEEFDRQVEQQEEWLESVKPRSADFNGASASES